MRSVRALFLTAFAIVSVFAVAASAQNASIDNQVYHAVRGLMHYNTFDLIAQDANAWKKRVESLGRRCEVLQPGDSLTF